MRTAVLRRDSGRSIDASSSGSLGKLLQNTEMLADVADEWAIWLEFWNEARRRDELRERNNEIYTRWVGMIESIVRNGQRQGQRAEAAGPDRPFRSADEDAHGDRTPTGSCSSCQALAVQLVYAPARRTST